MPPREQAYVRSPDLRGADPPRPGLGPGGGGRAGPPLRAGDPTRRALPPGRRAAGEPDRLDGHLPVGPEELLRPRRLEPVRPGDPRAGPQAADGDGPEQAGVAGPQAARLAS